MRDLGDFQTPPALVAAVLDRLGPIGSRWSRVLEPTCGRGHFLAGLLDSESPPREILGVELQAAHLDEARLVAGRAPTSSRVTLTQASLFDLDLGSALAWNESGPLLVVGNPPWVTNAELGALGSGNRPARSNARKARGIDALTGSSNFDIAEAIWLKLLSELADHEPTVALLCKTSVARNVLEHARRAGLPVSHASIVHIDARAWFQASVDACLLSITLGPGTTLAARIPVFDDLDQREPTTALGFAHARLVSDLDAYARFARFDGTCPLTWRQGLKHDAAAVMELAVDPSGVLRNKEGEIVDVEPGYVYPLLKGSDLARTGPVVPSRAVIVTQRSLADDTRRLEADAPKLWAYLVAHAEAFSRRKSSIYRGKPPFAMFGVGPYAFEPYKVVVSGLHKSTRFHAIGPIDGRPSMLDDTGYFLACRSPEQAALVATLLNGPEATGLIRALIFSGAKRPITAALLRRLDLAALLDATDHTTLLDRAGVEVRRLAGRTADWPDRPASLLSAHEPPETPTRIADGLRHD